MLLSSQKLYFTICSCGNRQSLRPLRRRHGRGPQRRASGLHDGVKAPAYFFHHTARLCARQVWAGHSQLHRMQPGRPFPFARARMRRAALGACARVRAARSFAPGAYLRARRAAFPFIPCARPCARRAASAPAVRARRLRFGPRLPRRAACPARRARAPPAFRPAFLRLRAQPAPAFAPPARFFLLCRALSHAQRPPACAKIRSFPFFPSRFSSASFRTLFSVRGPGPMHREKRPPGCAPGGPAAHAARCVSP